MTIADDPAAPRLRRAPADDPSRLSFEDALKELEGIVAQLERADVGLEPSIALYARGEALRAHCDALLAKADAKVEQIVRDAAGKPTGTAPLDAEDRG